MPDLRPRLFSTTVYRNVVPDEVKQTGPSDVTPLTILGANCLQWVQLDMGATIATGVSALADQSGNARDYVQGVGVAQPTYTATDATLNNLPTMTGDGVDDFLDDPGFALPAPNVTPYFVYAIVKQLSWTSNRRLWGDKSSAACSGIQLTSSPKLGQRSGVSVNATDMTIGSWYRTIHKYTGTVADSVQIGSVVTTGASAGITAGGTGRQIFAVVGTSNGNATLYALIYGVGDPATYAASLDSYYLARCGAGVSF